MPTFLAGLGRLALLGSILLTLDRVLDVPVGLFAGLAAFASYAVLGYAIAIALMLLALRGSTHRRRAPPAAVMVAVVGLAMHAVWLAPLYLGGTADGRPVLSVMTANLDLGQADSTTVVQLAKSQRVDVLVLQEVNPEELGLLEGAGLSAAYPYRSGEARIGGLGTMVFSRYALTDEEPVPVTHTGLAMTVQAPRPFRLLAAHTTSPANNVTRWATDLRTLRAYVRREVRSGPTILAGDLNATRDNRPFRQLLGEGLRDVRAQANAGRLPTWPTEYRRSWLRPLIGIDHVLVTPPYSATRVRAFEVPGTDHLAVEARLALT